MCTNNVQAAKKYIYDFKPPTSFILAESTINFSDDNQLARMPCHTQYTCICSVCAREAVSAALLVCVANLPFDECTLWKSTGKEENSNQHRTAPHIFRCDETLEIESKSNKSKHQHEYGVEQRAWMSCERMTITSAG